MLSSGAIRARIAAIVESLCRTAVTEITKVVEDGMMVLRLETVYRESEIKRLKGDIERLHVELRAGQEAGATPRRDHGARDNLSLHSNDRTLYIISPMDNNNNNNSNSASMVQRRELQDRSEEPTRQHEAPRDVMHDRDGDQTAPQNSSLDNSAPLLTSSNLDMGAHFGYNPYQSVFRAEPRREKTLNICPYCGKCFERAAHLERHKRIHTGEKPYQCETCGRCFNQNCSLKEHRKLHFRDAQLALQKASDESPTSSNKDSKDAIPNLHSNPNPTLNLHPVHNDALSPEEDAAPSTGRPESEDSSVPAVRIKSEPVEPSIEPPQIQPITIHHHEQEDGNDLSDRIEPLMSFPILNPISPPPLLNNCGAVQPYYMKDGQLLDMQKRAARPKRMYPCQYCPKVFGRSEHLERHVRIHTGEKPFGCYICGRCFSQKSSLKGHMRTHGNDRVMDMSLGDNSALLDPPALNLPPGNPSFINMFDPMHSQNSQDGGGWQHMASVKLEPKEEPLDSEYTSGDTSRDPAWSSALFDDRDPDRAEEMEYDHAEINIEIIPNNHGAPAVKSETALAEPGRPNGDAFEFRENADCDDGEKGTNSYICSVCGENYDDFNLFQKHQCLEQPQQTGGM